MAIYVSEPARPGPQRLPEVLRKRRVNEARKLSGAPAARPGSETGPETRALADQSLARRAARGYEEEAAADRPDPELAYLPVSQLVAHGVFSLDSRASVEQARTEMARHGIKHLVILHEGVLAGLIDLNWLLLQQLRAGSAAVELAALTLPSFITATPETDAHELARQMLGYQIDAAVIIDQDNQVTAVATATDYLRLYAQNSLVRESI